MKSQRIVLLSLWLMALTPLFALAETSVESAEPGSGAKEALEEAAGQEETDQASALEPRNRPQDDSRGTFRLGGWDADVSDSPQSIHKYEPIDGDIDLAIDAAAIRAWHFFAIDARYRATEDQKADIDFELGRNWRTKTSWDRFQARLAHDPLSNLEAATIHGRVVEHTDLDPLATYGLSWRLLEHRSELQFEGAEALTVGFGYRNQERVGSRQAKTISHCSGCHVYSQTRPIDETTEDVSVDATLDFARFQVKGSFVHRELDEGVQSISLLFDNALQPELLVPVFDDRLQWDSAEGPQPVHQRPDTTKETAKLEVTIPQFGGFDVNMAGIWSSTENDLTGYQADYNGYLLEASRRFGKNWRMRWRNRGYGLDNDDAFVTLNERRGIAGPAAGRTYAEIYGFPRSGSYIRRSALDRDVLESKLEFAHRFSKKAGTLRLQYDFEMTDRDHYEVAPGDTETTENVFGIAWDARPTKKLRVFTKLRHGEVDNPFVNLNGAYSTFRSGSAPNPFAPSAAQYYEFQDGRIADVGASPESWDEAELRGSLLLANGKTMVTASYGWWDGENTGLDLADWQRTNTSTTLSLFSSPKQGVSWNLSWARQEKELNFPNSIPIFDG